MINLTHIIKTHDTRSFHFYSTSQVKGNNWKYINMDPLIFGDFDINKDVFIEHLINNIDFEQSYTFLLKFSHGENNFKMAGKQFPLAFKDKEDLEGFNALYDLIKDRMNVLTDLYRIEEDLIVVNWCLKVRQMLI